MTQTGSQEDVFKRSPSSNCSDILRASVQKSHAALNRLITSRLPLSLPPHSNSPQAYLQGITAFGRIYEIFERVIAQQSRQKTCGRIPECLELLNVPGIRRTERLQRDIVEIQRRIQDPRQESYDRLRTKMLPIVDKVTKTLEEKPHLGLAYAWSMYLALFNGGKWIRGQLASADAPFWSGPAALSLWDFEGSQDGKDIHAHFKGNFEKAARQLTDTEWEDICKETARVFDMCTEIVGILDVENSKAFEARERCQRRTLESFDLLRAFYAVCICLALTRLWSVFTSFYH